MKLNTNPGRFLFDRRLIVLMVLATLALAARAWLHEHPQHNPWAPLALAHPAGWATGAKIAALRDDVPACHAVLERGGVDFSALPPAGEGACLRADRTVLADTLLAPASPQMTCPTATGLTLWLRHSVEPAAREVLGSPLARIEHMGTWNCRRIGGGEQGQWSEHATGNAIDVAAFVLEDGRRISVLAGWESAPEEQAFLRRVRDGACPWFATVLSPDYNAAHADHLHLDQADRMVGGVCR